MYPIPFYIFYDVESKVVLEKLKKVYHAGTTVLYPYIYNR